MIQHNHDYRPGHTYLESDHPDYLKVANGNVEDAHESHMQLADDEAERNLIDHAWDIAIQCERLARAAYVRWKQETCKHEVTRTWHTGSEYISMGEHYEDDTGGIDVCISCHKEIG